MLHIVTVATKNEGYFDYLVESCKRNGAKLEVLGWGQEWKGFSHRINLMRDYLQSLKDDDIVCFVDGYDVIILEPVEKLELLFRNSGKKIIFARDIDSFILLPMMKTYFEFVFGKCKNYTINAGTYIGYVKDLKDLYKKVYDKYDLTKHKDDQIILTNICNNHNNVSIDIERQLFLVTSYSDSNMYNLQINNKKLYLNNFSPCILHAVANTNIDQILKNLGYDISNIKRRKDISYYLQENTSFIIKNMYAIAIINVIVIIIIILVLGSYSKNSKLSRLKPS